MKPEGVAFELPTGGGDLDVPDPADLLEAQITVAPGGSRPSDPADLSVGVLALESGALTVERRPPVGRLHAGMVWVWPPPAAARDSATWETPLGRFDRGRWGRVCRGLFATHRLASNVRAARRIEVSAEGDGTFGRVDVDTLWGRLDVAGAMHCRGRARKVYACIEGHGRWWPTPCCSTTARHERGKGGPDAPARHANSTLCG